MAQGSHILYIEDERSAYDLVSHALKPLGYRVVRATSGRQGLSMMKKEKPDLLLLDLMMPDLNGWDVYRAVKTDEHLADMPVIVISARKGEQARMVIANLPLADEYILKPFDVEQVIRAVQKFV
ncbi:MAG: response regulator [Anaerolineales bacterium]|nr:response regulator [Anaerolineales bacterium]